MKKRLLVLWLALFALARPTSALAGGFFGPYTNGYGNVTGGGVQPCLPNIIAPGSLSVWLRADLGASVVLSAVTATGTTPPTVTLSGTPAYGQTAASYVELDVTGAGALGVATFQVKLNGSVVATGLNTGASVALPGTGLTSSWAAGVSATNDVYTANINASALGDQSGSGHNASQSTNASQVIYISTGGPNGVPYLLLTYAGSVYLTGTVGLSAPVEAFIAARSTTSGPGNYAYLFNAGGANNRSSTGQAQGANSLFQDSGNLVNTVAITINSDFVADSLINGASSTLSVNGGSVVGPANAGANGAAGGYQVGASNANEFGGRVYEVVVFTVSLTAAQEKELSTYYMLPRYGTP